MTAAGVHRVFDLCGARRPAPPIADPWMRWLLRPSSVTREAMSVWERLARIEHDRWNAYHYEAGWQFGPARVDAAKVHDNLRDWDGLDVGTRRFDREHVARLPALVAAIGDNSPRAEWRGKRVCRDVWIGVLGGLPPRDEDAGDGFEARERPGGSVAQAPADARWMEALVDGLLAIRAESPLPVSFTLVSPLEEGAQRDLAAMLMQALDARLVVALPFSFELYYLTFETSSEARWQSVRAFTSLVARADAHVEMPLRFGNVYDVGRGVPGALGERVRPGRGDDAPVAVQQYRLLHAYVAAHCDHLIVTDEPSRHSVGDPARPAACERDTPAPGSVEEVLAWWRDPQAGLPPAFRWRHEYREPPTPSRPEPFVVPRRLDEWERRELERKLLDRRRRV
jgi:hypothetical protein